MSNQQAFSNQQGTLIDKLCTYLRFRKVVKYIPENSKVLDLGCGLAGDFLRRVEPKISSGVGIDVAISQADKNPKIKLMEYDLDLGLPFLNEEFDVVVSMANLEHLEKPLEMFREIRRVLKKGGILVLTTPTIHAKPILEFMAFKLGVIDLAGVREHKNYFNKRLLGEFCLAAGFVSHKHSYFEFWMNNFLYAKK
jgi:SAM-dependent methyltransferase